jgi:hypothetical protein
MSEQRDYWGFEGKAYVTADGNYGSDIIIIFNINDLNEYQWEQLDLQIDRERIIYVQKILDGEDVSPMEG